ncbi:hypothetical protein QCA50_013580 [Cerrena zonata]|uniref:Uncharacterized protein n=1 Tax=Cerrena zonata TaxID=2478898 RepID=A0AAW0FNQ2_9APHY
MLNCLTVVLSSWTRNWLIGVLTVHPSALCYLAEATEHILCGVTESSPRKAIGSLTTF